MGLQPRRHIVRARQRSRTSLPAFARQLEPRFSEMGVDRFQLSVAGRWRLLPGQGADALTLGDYQELLSSFPADVDWFNLPERRHDSIGIKTRSRTSSTLGSVSVLVGGWRGGENFIRVTVVANPTRTLAHLLAGHPDAPDFHSHIANMSPFEFFTASGNFIPQAFGSSPDNWLADVDAARHRLGTDLFSAFLPIFVDQLQALIAALIAPYPHTRNETDGTDTVLAEPGIEIRLEWGAVRVPQIESYFERHHGQAVAGVRSAAFVALATLDRATVNRYQVLSSDWVERQDDCLSIGTRLTQRNRLSIYAKSASRIRFEIKRDGKGDYSSLAPPTHPAARLLAILDMERSDALTACRWPVVGTMFDEPDQPSVADLTRLCSLVAEACAAHGVSVQPVMARLMEDGGTSRTGMDNIPDGIVDRLCATGVLERVSIGQRDHRRSVKRVALRPEYRALVDAIASTLVTDLITDV